MAPNDHKRMKSWAIWYKKHGQKKSNPNSRSLSRSRVSGMSLSALSYTRKDLNDVIRVQEDAARKGAYCPKLGAYWDDLHEVLGELRRRGVVTPRANAPCSNPYPYEHAARIIDPKRMKKTSFRRKNVKGGSIGLIMGKPLTGRQVMTLQAVRFRSAHFSPSEAKAWLQRHNIKPIMFEPATSSRKASWAGESARLKRSRATRRRTRRTA